MVESARSLVRREHPTYSIALAEAVVGRAIDRIWTGEGYDGETFAEVVRAEATAASRTRPAVTAREASLDAPFDKDRSPGPIRPRPLCAGHADRRGQGATRTRHTPDPRRTTPIRPGARRSTL